MVKRRTLTQAKVLATANQLIESKGINGLTIRDLALVLDVRPQSIYNYVDSLSDLLDQVGLQFVQNVADRLTETISDVDGDEALMAFAQEFRAACNQHRGLAPLLLDLNDNLRIHGLVKQLCSYTRICLNHYNWMIRRGWRIPCTVPRCSDSLSKRLAASLRCRGLNLMNGSRRLCS